MLSAKRLKYRVKQLLSLFILDFKPREWMIVNETTEELYMVNPVTGEFQSFKKTDLEKR